MSIATDRDSCPADLAVRADGECAVADLRPALADLFAQSPDTAICSEGRPLPDDAIVGDPGLRAGCLLTLGQPGGRTNVETSVLQLRVVSGPDCGQIMPVRRGELVIGRNPQSGLQIADPDLSRRHAEVRADLQTMTVRDLGSTNGTLADGVSVGAAPVRVSPGCLINVGNSVLTVIGSAEPPAVVRPGAEADLLVYRPPKVAEPPLEDSVSFPAPITALPRPKMHWAAAMLPAAASALLALAMHSPQFLAFALLTPLTLIVSAISDRRDWRRGARGRRRAHTEAERAAQERLELLLSREALRRRNCYPDAATILHTVRVPDCRLWERRPGDADFLVLRLGLADQAAELVASREGAAMRAPVVRAVPATVSLTSHPLGIAGPTHQTRASARWLVSQLLALHSPADLRLIALLDGSEEDWRWLRWASAMSRFATHLSEWQSVIDDLNHLLAERVAAGTASSERWAGQWLVVLIDPAAAAAELAGLRALFENGPSVGITMICIGNDIRVLPAGCRATACVTSETGARLQITNPRQSPLTATVEGVSLDWADQLARRLAPLRDADAEPGSRLPTQVGLARLLGLAAISPVAIQSRWAGMQGRPSTPVGVCANGLFELDLVRDGPHLLVAGTTGSGKSELLRTLVTGLAASNAPDELSFVLIDYKGGAAFAECAQLPHTLGVVTDLDGYLTRRALVSLDAELRRREAAFARAAVADLGSYRLTTEAIGCPLPRLVLIIDEFAALAEELPDFLTGMLGIAQRGRSLGVHLVLATQRPAGAVSLDIKANMSLRIALRVTDSAESGDIIGDEAACRIPRDRPGRALARLSAGELVEFQAALVSLPATQPDRLVLTRLDRWNRIPPQPAPPRPVSSELQVLGSAIRHAARATDRPEPRAPWLAPLPDRIMVDQLDPLPDVAFQVSFGLTDDPGRQRQHAARLDLSAGGSVGFIGGPRSGRTSAVRTIIGQATRRLSAEQLNFYVLDCAGRGFAGIRELPQCGAVVERDDPATVARLISRLLTEVADRQRSFADLGASTLSEAIGLGSRLPALLLAIDGWEGLSALSDEHDAGRSADAVVQLLRDGPAIGLTVLLTGDRTALGVRIGSSIARKLVLPLTERSDYALAGISQSSLPAELGPGRAICTDDGLQTQLSLLIPDASAAAQLAAIQQAALVPPGSVNQPRITIRSLPDRVELDTLRAGFAAVAGQCLLGVGGDEAAATGCGLFAPHSRFLVVGPARCGRSNAVRIVAEQARSAGYTVLVAAPPRSPLAEWGRTHARWSFGPDDEVEPEGFSYSPDAVDAIVIDDAEQFTDCKMGEFLLDLVIRHPAAVIASARSDDLLVSFRGIGVELRRHRNGLLLHPTAADGELLGIRLGHHRVSQIPGRGLLITDEIRQTHPAGLPIQLARCPA